MYGRDARYQEIPDDNTATKYRDTGVFRRIISYRHLLQSSKNNNKKQWQYVPVVGLQTKPDTPTWGRL